MDPGLNSLLQWGIKNSDKTSDEPVKEPRGLSADALRSLMGGPSDADMMREAMTIISSDDTTLDAKVTAFDNFEQLVENVDNANNMEPVGLWSPLIAQFESSESDLRKMAAWCAGTAVQNNEKAQERFLALNGIQKICKLAVDDQDKAVRRKAVYALSSGIRNYQPAMNEAVKYLPKDIVQANQVSASDMEVIDGIMERLRER